MTTHRFKPTKGRPNFCVFCNKGHNHASHDVPEGYEAPPELEEVPTFEIRADSSDIIRGFEAAVRRHEMRNSFAPEQWEEIDGAYLIEKRRLFLHLICLQEEIDQ